MKNLELEKVTTAEDWRALFCDDVGAYAFGEDVQINIIGEGESSYMIINIYSSESSSTEYLFFPKDENEVGKARIYIFDFLKAFDFNLAKLLQWLSAADFQETEFGMAVDVGGMMITRTGFKAVV